MQSEKFCTNFSLLGEKEFSMRFKETFNEFCESKSMLYTNKPKKESSKGFLLFFCGYNWSMNCTHIKCQYMWSPCWLVIQGSQTMGPLLMGYTNKHTPKKKKGLKERERNGILHQKRPYAFSFDFSVNRSSAVLLHIQRYGWRFN